MPGKIKYYLIYKQEKNRARCPNAGELDSHDYPHKKCGRLINLPHIK